MVCDDTQRKWSQVVPRTTRDYGTTYENLGFLAVHAKWSRGPEQNRGTTYEKAVVPWSLKGGTTWDHASPPIRSACPEGAQA